MQPAIFLDRDGTVIHDRVYLNDPNQVEFIAGAIEALKLFKTLGYKLIIVTNQSGVARGLVQIDKLEEIHKRMQKDAAASGGFSFDGFYYSPHAADSDHFQRKPNPGMIEDAIRDHNVDRNLSWMIGDKMSDVEAGHRARLRTVFITGTEDPKKSGFSPAHYSAADLLEAAHHVEKLGDRR